MRLAPKWATSGLKTITNCVLGVLLTSTELRYASALKSPAALLDDRFEQPAPDHHSSLRVYFINQIARSPNHEITLSSLHSSPCALEFRLIAGE